MNEQPETQPSEEAVISDLQGKIKFLYDKRNPGRFIEAHDRIAVKLQELEKRYLNGRNSNIGDYYLFHVLSKSTIDRRACPYFDFPGDDSAVKLIEDLYREYQGEGQ